MYTSAMLQQGQVPEGGCLVTTLDILICQIKISEKTQYDRSFTLLYISLLGRVISEDIYFIVHLLHQSVLFKYLPRLIPKPNP
jgi:hypothetical protein